MSNEEKAGEKRSYFRVDDIISVVANPIHLDKEMGEEFRKSAVGSRVFPLMDVSGPSEPIEEGISDHPGNARLYSMMSEIKTKLDFIINHFITEREGLGKDEKKFVNISASGIRFTITHPVNVNDIMEIKLLLPTHPPVVVFAYGEVKRVRALEDNKFEVSIEYLNMGDSVRNEIIQYTLSTQRETIRRIKESGANE